MATIPCIQLVRSAACRNNIRLLQCVGAKYPSRSTTSVKGATTTNWRCWHPTKNVRRCMFSSSSGGGDDDGYNNTDDPHAMFKEQMEQLKLERQDMFGFTEEEEDSWSNVGSGQDQLPSSLMKSVEQARAEQQAKTVESPETSSPFMNIADNTSSNDTILQHNTSKNEVDYEPSHGLTHLSEDGSSVNMVDVGNKAVTQRMARAETRVIFPPEVVAAFQQSQNNDELIGPKGPIFATAKIAGIMAAK